jgi:tRNA pseudouridine55 synthase
MPATSTDVLLLVDKPAGVTSHDAVTIARRVLGARRAGHGGTLDPFATGLLLILAGRGTRLVSWLPAEPKVYRAGIRFGSETDTDDAAGTVIREAPMPARDAVTRAILQLTGAIEQVPPAFSAKHVGGQRAYALARRGDVVALPAVNVIVHRWDVEEQEPGRLVALISCKGGTYVRALARDLGRLAGSAAHLATLRRTAVGPFRVEDAVTLPDLKDGRFTPIPLRDALGDIAEVRLDSETARRVSHGMSIAAGAPGDRAALLDPHGGLLAVAVRQGDSWKPEVVLHDA